MANGNSASRPVYALSWEERHPARYDSTSVDLSKWADLTSKAKESAAKGQGKPKANTKAK